LFAQLTRAQNTHALIPRLKATVIYDIRL